jgi:hypothetical protein
MGQITETTVELQVVVDDADAGNIGKTSTSDVTDTSATAAKKSGFHPLGASASNAPNTERAVIITAVRDTASANLRYSQILVTESNDLFIATDDNGTKSSWAQMATVATTQTLTNKTLTSPVLTTPQINDASLDHQYVFVGSELAADRNVTLPVLASDDEFVFKAAAQTLTNKALNGTLGATTPASAAVTTLTATSNILTPTWLNTTAGTDGPTISGDGQAGFYSNVTVGAAVRGQGSAYDFILLNQSGVAALTLVADGTAIALAGTLGVTGAVTTGTAAAAGATSGNGITINPNGVATVMSDSTTMSYWNQTSYTSGTIYHVDWRINGSAIGSVSNNGSAVAYNTTSDIRLKSEFVNIDDSLAAQMVKDAVENKWVGVFSFKSDPDSKPVAGYNAHAIIDNQEGYGGTEGLGPRDAELGSVYEVATYEQATDEDGNLLFDDITEKAQRPRTWQKPVMETIQVPVLDEEGKETGETEPKESQKTEPFTETVTVAEVVVDGVLIPEHEQTTTTDKPVFTTENVLDQGGNIVYEEYDNVIGTEPRMVEVTPEKAVSPAGVDQSKRVPLLEAALYNALKRIEALEP